MNSLAQKNPEASEQTQTKEELDPLFLRKQALSEDLARLATFEARLRQIDRKILYNLGLGGAQGAAIQSIARNGGTCSPTALHRKLAVSKQSLHKSLARLIAGGYIEQLGKDASDQRRHIIALTKKGRELEQLLGERRTATLSKVYRVASAQQVEGFRRTLAHLSEASMEEMGLGATERENKLNDKNLKLYE